MKVKGTPQMEPTALRVQSEKISPFTSISDSRNANLKAAKSISTAIATELLLLRRPRAIDLNFLFHQSLRLFVP